MFNAWLRDQTGLSLYDFRVLDMYGDSEKEVRDFFHMWIEEVHPVPQKITEAIEDAAGEGFELFIV